MSGIPILRPAEGPRDRAQRLVAGAAHALLADLLLADVTGEALATEPLRATAFCPRSRLRIVVRLTRYDGAAYETAGRIPPRPPTRCQRQILAVCDRAVPIDAKKLARKLGKRRPDSYLHKMLRELVAARRLKKVGRQFLLR